MLHRRAPILLPALQNGDSVVREFCWGWERMGARLAAQRAFVCFGRQNEGRKTGTQWVQPPKAVSALQFRQTTSGAHISAGRADGLLRGKSLQAAGIGICRPIGFQPASVFEGFQRASGKPFGAPAGALPLPRVGNDAPTTARVVGLPPRGGIVISFDAKESTKESVRHGDSGKKPVTAHF